MNLRDAARSATDLMIQHGLINKGWRFEFDGAVSRGGGLCSFRKKVISLSEHFTERSEWEGSDGVKNLVLHEIAHALAGPKAHHGPAWKAVAQSIGCTGERCHAATMPERQFTYGCPNGHVVKRHRRIHRPLACTRCCKAHNGGKFSEDYLLTLKGA